MAADQVTRRAGRDEDGSIATAPEVSQVGRVSKLAERLNLVDRIYMVWFTAATALVLASRERLAGWPWFLAINAVAVGVIWWLASGRAPKGPRHFLHHWYPLAMAIVCFLETARFSMLIVPEWQDEHILAWERAMFDVPPTVWLQQFKHPVLTELLQLGYFSYFTYQMVVGGVLYRPGEKRAFRQLMTAVALTYTLCSVVYVLFPTESPARTLREQHTVVFHGGFFHFLVLLIQKYFGVHGNAFPSSHVAASIAALIVAWKYTRKVAWFLTPLVLLMCVGAVYDRYHYFSDVWSGILVGAAVSAFVIGAWNRIATSRDREA